MTRQADHPDYALWHQDPVTGQVTPCRITITARLSCPGCDWDCPGQEQA